MIIKLEYDSPKDVSPLAPRWLSRLPSRFVCHYRCCVQQIIDTPVVHTLLIFQGDSPEMYTHTSNFFSAFVSNFPLLGMNGCNCYFKYAMHCLKWFVLGIYRFLRILWHKKQHSTDPTNKVLMTPSNGAFDQQTACKWIHEQNQRLMLESVEFYMYIINDGDDPHYRWFCLSKTND